MPLDFSTIQFPDGEGDKPADISFNTIQDINNQTAQTASEQQNETQQTTTDPVADQDQKTDATTDAATAKDSTTEATSDATTTDQTAQPDKLTPFHEHPDWKKLQEEKHQLEVKLARLEGSVQSLNKPEPQLAPLPFENVKDLAADLMAKKKAAGWQPQSAEEVAMVTEELWEQARQTFASHEEAEQKALVNVRQREIIDTVGELGLSGADKETSRQTLFKIASKIDPQLQRNQRDVLMEAYELMRELTPATQTQTTQPSQPTTQTDQTTQTTTQQPATPSTTAAQTNRRISMGASSGTSNGQSKEKRSFDQFKKESLDQAIERAIQENNLQ